MSFEKSPLFLGAALSMAVLASCGGEASKPAPTAAEIQAALRPTAVKLASEAIRLSQGPQPIFEVTLVQDAAEITYIPEDRHDKDHITIFTGLKDGQPDPQAVRSVKIHDEGCEDILPAECTSTQDIELLAPVILPPDQPTTPWTASEDYQAHGRNSFTGEKRSTFASDDALTDAREVAASAYSAFLTIVQTD